MSPSGGEETGGDLAHPAVNEPVTKETRLTKKRKPAAYDTDIDGFDCHAYRKKQKIEADSDLGLATACIETEEPKFFEKAPKRTPKEDDCNLSTATNICFTEYTDGSIGVNHQTIKVDHLGPIPIRVRPSKHEFVYQDDRPVNEAPIRHQPLNSSAKLLLKEIIDKDDNKLQRYNIQMYNDDKRSDQKRQPVVSNPYKTNLDPTVPPVCKIDAIFDIIANKASELNLEISCRPFKEQGLRVVTMCSGTESPLLALGMLSDALVRANQPGLPVEHLASAEIEPFKQAYIQRNFAPGVLFRDVTEFSHQADKAHTAFGGWAEQPKHVHILIAGSSCIDYSSLNGNKKDFGDKGESISTLKGILDYAARHKPNVVIIENVEGAPWDEIVNEWDSRGYFGVVLFVDSKDFYIPQTRQRGYMVGFNKQRAESIGLDLKNATGTLVSCIKYLSQRASAPYQDFIFSDDDPELQQARVAMSRSPDKSDHNIDWAACRIRYAAYRVQRSLGSCRPVTQWKNGGKSQFFDYAWMAWARMQRERIFDTLDINFLAYLSERHYDMTFKSRFVELSQNVDRDQDSRHWGLTGCITPSGMPWDTLRGGPVFGKEVLALQGIPVDALSLNHETSRQLQDLAGNAMTSTVIGCIAIGAIIASCVTPSNETGDDSAEVLSMFEKFNIAPKADLKPPEFSKFSPGHNISTADEFTDQLVLENSLVHNMVNFGNENLGLTELETLAAVTLPLCKCDYWKSKNMRKFWLCKLCGHTACDLCFGNPRHDYEDITASVAQRHRKAEDFTNLATTIIPPALRIKLSSVFEPDIEQILKKARCFEDHRAVPDVVNPEPLQDDDWKRYKSAVVSAMNSTVYHQSTKQESEWRVIFEAPNARLELRLSLQGSPYRDEQFPTHRISSQWLLYGKPDAAEPAISIVRDHLLRPVARMIPEKNDVLKGNWQVWDPSMPYGQLSIQGIGDEIDAWESRMGLQKQPFRDLKSFRELKITQSSSGNENLSLMAGRALKSLCGQYAALRDCGSACGSLHIMSSPIANTAIPAYLFLDSKPLQNRFLDRMTFAPTHHRLPYGVNRQITAELAKAWRPNSLTLKPESNTAAHNVPCRLIDIWHDGIDISLNCAVTDQEMTLWTPTRWLINDHDCEMAKILFLSHLQIGKLPQSEWKRDGHYTIELVDRPAALKDFQCILKRLASKIVGVQETFPATVDNSSCQSGTCSPVAPKIKWRYTRKRQKNLINKAIVRPFEDPEEATKYEQLLSNRPVPIIAEVHKFGDQAHLVVGLNINTVLHRLACKLNLHGNEGEFSWKLGAYSGFEDEDVLPKLKLENTIGDRLWPHGDLLYANKPDAEAPSLLKNRKLWDNQRRALAWMRQVEEGLDWTEWDAEYFNVPALDIQLQVEATKKVKVRGAIEADEVGAGKTITSLALVARSLEDLAMNRQTPNITKSNKLKSRATLILVPSNIQNQWLEEIKSCFDSASVKIISVALHQKRNFPSVDDILNADILLMSWNLFQTDTGRYWSELSEFCCAPNCPKDAGRAFNQWLDVALEDLEDIVQSCGTRVYEAEFLKHRESQKASRKEKYRAFCVFSGDINDLNRLKKKKEVQRKPGEKKEPTPKKELDNNDNPIKKDGSDKKLMLAKKIENMVTGRIAPDAIDDEQDDFDEVFDLLYEWKPKGERMPLLHLFDFDRLIVDEFTYLKPKSLQAVATLFAQKKWMLSGTPPIADNRSINTMGTLIGTQVAIEPTASSIFSFKDTRSISNAEKTYAEEFREKICGYSPAWNSARNQRSVDFVGQFVRQNLAPRPKGIGKIEHYIVLPQSTLEAYLSNKAFQYITGPFLRFGLKKIPDIKLAEWNREDRFRQRIQEAESPEAALLSCHARTIDLYLKNKTDTSDKTMCDELVAEMHEHLSQLRKEITETLQGAYWYWTDGPSKVDTADNIEHFCTYLHCVLHRTFGDNVAAELLGLIAAYARENPLESKAIEPTKEDTKGTSNSGKPPRAVIRKKVIQDMSTRLNELSMQLVAQIQQFRLLRAISSIEGDHSVIICDACEDSMNTAEVSLLGQCGHMICNKCLEATAERDYDVKGCPVVECTNSSKDSCVSAQSYTTGANCSTSNYGSKVDAVVNKIQSIDKKDHILVFIQSDAQRDQLKHAFDTHNVSYEDGTHRTQLSIKRFQEQVTKSTSVLILRIDSEDSAGWNLQIANHVMFITPFLTKTQYDYEATMTQAIGRALRYGQKKDVHVYHFMMASTIDVNIIQQRTGKRLVKGDGSEHVLVDRDDERARTQEDLAGPSIDGVANMATGDGDDDEN